MGEWATIDCFRCGKFRIKMDWREILGELNFKSDNKIASVSGWIREHQNELLQKEPLAAQLTRRSPTVGEKAERLLRAIAKVIPIAGQQLSMQLHKGDEFLELFSKLPPFQAISLEDEQVAEIKIVLYLMGVSYCQSVCELQYLLTEFLIGEKRFLISESTAGIDYKISPAGWAFLDDSGKMPDSIQAFVAMWFSNETGKLWTEGIYPAIVGAGYKPFRIDKHDHNNRIDDEIIASIKRSKFLVADFTGQRGGVYFEAGFALGIGQEVIWLCREDALKEVHFDTRQYNHITWGPDKLPELSRALTLRIEATIGRGSYRE